MTIRKKIQIVAAQRVASLAKLLPAILPVER